MSADIVDIAARRFDAERVKTGLGGAELVAAQEVVGALARVSAEMVAAQEAVDALDVALGFARQFAGPAEAVTAIEAALHTAERWERAATEALHTRP